MRASSLILSPGAFRIALAYIVFANHALPLSLGSTAVYLFFMLSGYWVYAMWDKEYAPTSRPYLNFIASRFWRLLPVYYLSVLAFHLTARVFPGDLRQYQPADWWQAVHYAVSQLLVLGYAPLPPDAQTLRPVWSLDIELQFYLVAPICIAILTRYGARSWPRLALHGVAMIGFLAFILFYWGIRAQSGFLPMYLAFFLIGLGTARYDWRPSPWLAAGGLAIAAIAASLCLAIPATRPLLLDGSFSTWLSDYDPDANIVLALLLSPYAMATVRQTARWPRFDRDLSNITYEIYLLHPSALAIVHYCAGGASRYAQVPAVILAALLLFPVSWMVYRLFDRPIDGLRVSYVKSRPRRMAREAPGAFALASMRPLPMQQVATEAALFPPDR